MSLSLRYSSIKTVAEKIVALCTEKDEFKEGDNSDPYLSNLYNENFCSDFSETFKEDFELQFNDSLI